MRNFLVAAKASDPAERIRVIQQVRALIDQIPGVRLRVQGDALDSAFGNPPQALPIEADEAGLRALQNAVGDLVAIDPDTPLHPSSVGSSRTKRTKQMAQNNTGPVAENKDPASTRAVSSPAGASSPASGASSLPQAPIPLKAAKRQYLISSIGGSTAVALGLQSLPAVNLRDTIRRLDIDIVGVVPGLLPATLGALGSTSGGFFVTEIEPARAEALRRNVPPNIAIEENHRLGYGDPPMSKVDPRTSLSLAAAGVTQTFPITVRIVGRGGAPIEGAMVQLASDGLSEGKTDANGLVTLNLVLAPGGRARLLYVDVPRDHWDIYVQDPDIAPGQTYEVRAKSLFEMPEILPNFPAEFRFGWGQRLMELDRIPADCDGAGVRIAIIDSGADRTHPLLQHIQQGFDATQDNMIGGNWAQDLIGHGTHCAGIITARPADGHAMRGFAPAAEIIVFKIFPGGDFTALARCINRCVELQVDIVNLSLGASVSANLAVDQTMEAAVRSGIAFVVAAGNSGSDVQYPASSRFAMAVAALGAQGMFPENTYDESTIDPTLPMVEALFSPNFTCRGPQVAVTAPGVSIVSSWPNGYNPDSGTSMAAPHVTGLAALLLAHHPIFRGQFRERNAARVNALYQLIRSISAPIAFGADRVGAGIPRLGTLAATLMPTQKQPAAGPGQTLPFGTSSPISPVVLSGGQGGVQPGFLVPQAIGGPIFVPQGVGLGGFGQNT